MSGTLPITVSESDFTVGAVSTTPLAKIATYMAEAVINTAWNQANTMKADFSTKIGNISTGFLDITNSPHVTAGTVTIPTINAPGVAIPTSVDTAAIISTFNTEQATLHMQIVSDCANFLSTYFPDESNAYTAAENWLQAAIADPSGLPPSVRQAIIGDAEAAILADKVRAQDAAVAQFAARRFPLPPDVSASLVLRIEQKAQDEIAEVSRKIVIGSIDLQKFNVEKLLGLRDMAINAALKYISALIMGPEVASKVVGIGYDAQSKLISSAADFYRADANAADVKAKVDQFNKTTALEAATKNQAADLTMIEDKLKALMVEAQSIAQMATSMFNNVRADAGLRVTA